MLDDLKIHFTKTLKLPEDATEWLLMLYRTIQTFDDYADGDKVERKELNALIWNTLVGMNQNTFYLRNSQLLWPILATSILKWEASNTIEKQKKPDARSFMWRAGYYDVVLFVYIIYYGHEKASENAHIILNLYGEKLKDYIKEVKDA